MLDDYVERIYSPKRHHTKGEFAVPRSRVRVSVARLPVYPSSVGSVARKRSTLPDDRDRGDRVLSSDRRTEQRRSSPPSATSPAINCTAEAARGRERPVRRLRAFGLGREHRSHPVTA